MIRSADGRLLDRRLRDGREPRRADGRELLLTGGHR